MRPYRTAASALGLSLLVIVLALLFDFTDPPAPGSTPTATTTGEPGTPTPTPNPQPDPRPNVLFVLVDDLDSSLMRRQYLPRLYEAVVDRGISFANFFVDVSICCPSRASTLRGQYMHNTQIYTNVYPGGGFQKFRERGLEESTVATWLQDAGYRTALIGKYLNGYPATVAENYVPPGWDAWVTPSGGTPYVGFDYALNDNGEIEQYRSDESDYLTDVLREKAAAFIDRSIAEGRPFFLYLAPYAPHEPATPAPRHAGAFANVTAPRPPSFDEADVRDKPSFIRGRPRLAAGEIARFDLRQRNRARSLLAVDEMIDALLDQLAGLGELDNTYIFFTSDNGYHMGQHRLAAGKYTAYDEDTHVPLVVAGPGVPAGVVRLELALNIDLAPTFAELAGTTLADFVDGRSLAPLLTGAMPATWRTAVLYEQGARETVEEQGLGVDRSEPRAARQAVAPDLRSIRTERYVYTGYSSGDQEFYDLVADPFQLRNAVERADAALLDYLRARLAELSNCQRAGCREAEDAAAFEP